MTLLLLIACLPPLSGTLDVRPSPFTSSTEDTGGTDVPDTASGDDSGGPDDTNPPDTDSVDDTSGSTDDTGGDSDTGSPPCTGIAEVRDSVVAVDSETAEVSFTVGLYGCATGVKVADNSQSVGACTWSVTWTSVPSEFSEVGSATGVFRGCKSHEGEMWFYFTSDQGDNDLFKIVMNP